MAWMAAGWRGAAEGLAGSWMMMYWPLDTEYDYNDKGPKASKIRRERTEQSREHGDRGTGYHYVSQACARAEGGLCA